MFYVYEWFAYMYICTTCMPGNWGNWKRALDPLELKLWPPCGFWESKLRFSGRTASVLNNWAISLALIYFFKSLKYFSVWLYTQEIKSKDLRYLHRKKKRYLYSCVHWLFIHISQEVEITQMSIIGCEVGKCGLATYTWWPPPPAQFLLFICTTTRTSLDVSPREVCGFGKPRPHQADPGNTLGPSSLLFCSPATIDPIRQYLHNASFFDSYSVAGIWILFLSRGRSTWNSLVWGPSVRHSFPFPWLVPASDPPDHSGCPHIKISERSTDNPTWTWAKDQCPQKRSHQISSQSPENTN